MVELFGKPVACLGGGRLLEKMVTGSRSSGLAPGPPLLFTFCYLPCSPHHNGLYAPETMDQNQLTRCYVAFVKYCITVTGKIENIPTFYTHMDKAMWKVLWDNNLQVEKFKNPWPQNLPQEPKRLEVIWRKLSVKRERRVVWGEAKVVDPWKDKEILSSSLCPLRLLLSWACKLPSAQDAMSLEGKTLCHLLEPMKKK